MSVEGAKEYYMCKAAHEAGGPRRCSGDARATVERSASEVSALERVEAALRVESDESLFRTNHVAGWAHASSVENQVVRVAHLWRALSGLRRLRHAERRVYESGRCA